MSRPRFCGRCKCGDNGNGIFVKSFLWSHDSFLRQTNRNIKRYGAMEKLDACNDCVKEIESRGHLVRRKK